MGPDGESIQELKALYLDCFDEELSDGEAALMAARLVELYRILLTPPLDEADYPRQAETPSP
jgi:hypothetical protein